MGGFGFIVLRRNLKEWHKTALTRGHLQVLRKAAKVTSTATVSRTVYWSYPILPFGIVACTFFFDNLSRNSCILKCLTLYSVGRMKKPCDRGYILAVWTGVRKTRLAGWYRKKCNASGFWMLQRYHRSKETLVGILRLPFKCGRAGKTCLVLLNLQVFLRGFGTIKTLFKV